LTAIVLAVVAAAIGCTSRSSSGGTSTAALDGGVLADPVQGSEGDTTLLGTDGNNNGIRDDLEAYIATLESDPEKVTALDSFARESTAMMVLGGTTGTTKVAASAQAQRVASTVDCLHDLYVSNLSTKQTIVQDVRNALYNNALRLGAYNHASTLVSGTLLYTGQGCDPAITGVDQ
jgi:hypothetical protein